MQILIKQVRVGQYGKPFTIYKFRTMKKSTDRLFQNWNKNSNTMNTVCDETFNKYAEPDLRVTKVGKFLRKTGIDELPQFYNIVRGEMTLIGPRPILPAFQDKCFSPEQIALRQKYKPGLIAVGYSGPTSDQVSVIKNEMVYLREREQGNRFLVNVKYFFKVAFNLLSGRAKNV